MNSAGQYIEGFRTLLLDLVGQAAIRADEAKRPAKGETEAERAEREGGASITCIIFAATAVEAHVSEWLAGAVAGQRIGTQVRDDWIRDKSSVTDVIKDIRNALYNEGDRPPLGEKWYERLVALGAIRNSIVHYVPRPRPSGDWPEKLRAFIENGTIEPVGTDEMDWTSRLFVAEIADDVIHFTRTSLSKFDEMVAQAN